MAKRLKFVKEEIRQELLGYNFSPENIDLILENYSTKDIRKLIRKRRYYYNNKASQQEFYERAKFVGWNINKKDINTYKKRENLLPILEQKEVENNVKYECLYLIVTYKDLFDKGGDVANYMNTIIKKWTNKKIEDYIIKTIEEGHSFGNLGDINVYTSKDLNNKNLFEAKKELAKKDEFVLYAGLPKTIKSFLQTILMIVMLVYMPFDKKAGSLAFTNVVRKNIKVKTVNKKAEELYNKIIIL